MRSKPPSEFEIVSIGWPPPAAPGSATASTATPSQSLPNETIAGPSYAALPSCGEGSPSARGQDWGGAPLQGEHGPHRRGRAILDPDLCGEGRGGTTAPEEERLLDAQGVHPVGPLEGAVPADPDTPRLGRQGPERAGGE